MASHLVIVESPAKAKTIEKYLGKDFKVLASYGHVRDLVPKEGAVETDNNFKMNYSVVERNEKHINNIKKEFLLHMEKMFELASVPDGKLKAKNILNIETKIAEHHWTRVDNRNPDKTYNKYALSDMGTLMPDWDWQLYTDELGISKEDSVIVYQPTFLKSFNDVFNNESLENWKAYYTWRVLTTAAPYLSADFVTENFNFFSNKLAIG